MRNESIANLRFPIFFTRESQLYSLQIARELSRKYPQETSLPPLLSHAVDARKLMNVAIHSPPSPHGKYQVANANFVVRVKRSFDVCKLCTRSRFQFLHEAETCVYACLACIHIYINGKERRSMLFN